MRSKVRAPLCEIAPSFLEGGGYAVPLGTAAERVQARDRADADPKGCRLFEKESGVGHEA